MPEGIAVLERTVDDYKSDTKPTWCPGCGDFGVLNAVYNAFKEKGWAPEEVVCVSGIGCSSRLPYFMSTYGFHTIHGRAMPITTGIRVARPDLKVVAFGGDGDAFAIGAGHFVHAARRNLDIAYVIMDNAIYGLTKGQTSPTSGTGFTTKTTPQGSVERPLNPLMLALTCGATFVARAFSGRPKELADLMVRAIDHKGFALIDVFSPCPTFNTVNTFKMYREATAPVPEDHDTSDLLAAMRLAAQNHPLYTGVFYERTDAPSYEELQRSLQPETPEDPQKLLGSLFARFSPFS